MPRYQGVLPHDPEVSDSAAGSTEAECEFAGPSTQCHPLLAWPGSAFARVVVPARESVMVIIV